MIDSYQIPFTLDPPIKTYPGYSFVLSMLFATSDRYLPWLFNHYIIPIGNNLGTKYEFIPSDPFHVSEGVIQYLSTNIAPELLYDDRVFFDFIAAMLRQGFGLTCWMNEKHIPNRHAYQRYDNIHDNMIVGYDKPNQTVLIIGYSPVGRYEATTLKKDLLILSLLTNKQTTVALNFIRPNPAFTPVFDANSVRMQIEHYLKSTSIDELGHSEFYGIKEWKTGIDATNSLANFPIRELKYYDLRTYSFLRDRIELMTRRIKYMQEIGFRMNNNGIIEEMERMRRISIATHLLALKYNLTPQNKYIDTIRDNIHEIVRLESNLLPAVWEI
jgi:hypothetical protein